MESFIGKNDFILEQQQSFETINSAICKKTDLVTSDKSSKKPKSSKSMSVGNMCLTYSKKESESNSRIQFPKMPSNTKRNARERKRVRTINDYFNQLQKYLPYSKPATSSSTPGPKKLSKVETLKAAIEFIEYLQQFAPIKNFLKQNITSPNSVSSVSYTSSPTSAASFPSNLSLTEKLKIKCESLDNKREKSGQFKPCTDNAIEGQVLYDSSSFNNNASLSLANTVHSNNFTQVYATDAQNSELYYNYNSKSYQYAEVNRQVAHLQSPNDYSSYTSQMNETKLFNTQELNSSPTYSTSSSECYGPYNQNNVPEATMPIDYNNNNVCFSRLSEHHIMGNIQYPQYHMIDSQNPVHYC